MVRGGVGDMREMGVYECMKVKEQAVISAVEAAEMILRVDKIYYCAPVERTKTGLHN